MNIGLCLAGGGVKGAAHIGALKAFEEENINFQYILGTSSGSIVAALYAVGYNSEEIYELFKKYCKKIKYIDIMYFIREFLMYFKNGKIQIEGLNSGNVISKIINKACDKKNIKNINQINKKLIIPSVDLYNGKVYMFTSKSYRETISDEIVIVDDINIGKAVQASCSYPGVFAPCKYENTKLIDGGIRENIPWKELKKNGVDKVISIVFEENLQNKNDLNIVDIIFKSINILSHELANYEINGADYLIKIKTNNIKLLDIKKIDYLYETGYMITKKKIKEIKNTHKDK